MPTCICLSLSLSLTRPRIQPGDALANNYPRESYTLRHSYAQAMRDLGVDRDTIEWTTGHKSQDMLFARYATEVGLDKLRAAVNQLDFGFNK